MDQMNSEDVASYFHPCAVCDCGQYINMEEEKNLNNLNTDKRSCLSTLLPTGTQLCPLLRSILLGAITHFAQVPYSFDTLLTESVDNVPRYS